MKTWQRSMVLGLSVGAGFTLMAAMIGGAAVWYMSRPTRPTPWDKTAITASYNVASTEPASTTIVLNYTLHNNTDSAWTLHDLDNTSLFITGHKGEDRDRGDLTAVSGTLDHFVVVETPLFLPAHERLRVLLHLDIASDRALKNGASEEEKREHTTQIERFLLTEWPLIGGFVLLDDSRRYSVEFPGGWSAVRTTDATPSPGRPGEKGQE
jgi:hypothetical protein